MKGVSPTIMSFLRRWNQDQERPTEWGVEDYLGTRREDDLEVIRARVISTWWVNDILPMWVKESENLLAGLPALGGGGGTPDVLRASKGVWRALKDEWGTERVGLDPEWMNRHGQKVMGLFHGAGGGAGKDAPGVNQFLDRHEAALLVDLHFYIWDSCLMAGRIEMAQGMSVMVEEAGEEMKESTMKLLERLKEAR